ncbi:hypothetical protein BRARA_K00405 [Brassica rapa]|uniref:KOW domain-containing protein n=1 Tax=Brassica campestris TaxID=3711 RepID=A0A397KY02_BRACM|nr:hypothetical protein BRARA_K00405 [Brassica rapa]
MKRLSAPKHWMLDKLGGAFGRFRVHSIRDEEAKVRTIQFEQKGIPFLNTYDGRTLENKIVEFIKFAVGNVVMVAGGTNRGRVSVIKNSVKGVKLTIIEEATKRLAGQHAA